MEFPQNKLETTVYVKLKVVSESLKELQRDIEKSVSKGLRDGGDKPAQKRITDLQKTLHRTRAELALKEIANLKKANALRHVSADELMRMKTSFESVARGTGKWNRHLDQTERNLRQLSAAQAQHIRQNKITTTGYERFRTRGRLLQFLSRVRNSLLLATFAFAGMFRVMQKGLREFISYQASLTGLSSVARNTGTNLSEVQMAVNKLTESGLITAQEAAAGLKNLLAKGWDISQALAASQALLDAAAFNRQGTLALGEAYVGATEGLKNLISNKVDNAGVTKNLCLVKYSLVLDVEYNEWRTVEELYEEQQDGRGEIVVLAYDIEHDEFVKTSTNGIAFNGVKPVFEITTESGAKFTATHNHRFLTHDGYKKLEDLDTDDYLVGVHNHTKEAKYPRTCKHCGKDFKGESPRQWYCNGCTLKTCKVCGKEFHIDGRRITKDTKYCSKDCQRKDGWLKFDKTCENCGKDFTSKNPSQLWCHECLTNTCEYCNKDYRIPKRGRKDSRFCSVRCKADYQSEFLSKENHPGYKDGRSYTTFKNTCDYCGEDYDTTYNKTQHKDTHFCSNDCRYSWAREKPENNPSYNRVEVKCEVCGEVMLVSPSDASIVRFCTQSCKDRFESRYGETKNSKTYEELLDRREYDPQYIAWRKDVYKKYNYTCQHCGSTENIHAHHIVQWIDDTDKRYDADNGVALCKDCHRKVHKKRRTFESFGDRVVSVRYVGEERTYDLSVPETRNFVIKGDLEHPGCVTHNSIMEKEYAAAIGKTVGRLTEAEKSQAHYVGLLKEATLFTGDLATVSETLGGKMSLLSQSMRQTFIQLGTSLGPFFSEMIEGLTNFNRLIAETLSDSSSSLNTFFSTMKDILTPFAKVFVIVGKVLLWFIRLFPNFTAGLVVALPVVLSLVKRLGLFTETTKGLGKVLADFSVKLSRQGQSLRVLKERVTESTVSLNSLKDRHLELINSNKKLNSTQRDQARRMSTMISMQGKYIKSLKRTALAVRALSVTIGTLVSILSMVAVSFAIQGIMMLIDKLHVTAKEAFEGFQNAIEATIDEAERLRGEIGLYSGEITDLEKRIASLKVTGDARFDSHIKFLERELELTRNIKKETEDRGKQARTIQAETIASSIKGGLEEFQKRYSVTPNEDFIKNIKILQKSLNEVDILERKSLLSGKIALEEMLAVLQGSGDTLNMSTRATKKYNEGVTELGEEFKKSIQIFANWLGLQSEGVKEVSKVNESLAKFLKNMRNVNYELQIAIAKSKGFNVEVGRLSGEEKLLNWLDTVEKGFSKLLPPDLVGKVKELVKEVGFGISDKDITGLYTSMAESSDKQLEQMGTFIEALLDQIKIFYIADEQLRNQRDADIIRQDIVLLNNTNDIANKQKSREVDALANTKKIIGDRIATFDESYSLELEAFDKMQSRKAEIFKRTYDKEFLEAGDNLNRRYDAFDKYIKDLDLLDEDRLDFIQDINSKIADSYSSLYNDVANIVERAESKILRGELRTARKQLKSGDFSGSRDDQLDRIAKIQEKIRLIKVDQYKLTLNTKIVELELLRIGMQRLSTLDGLSKENMERLKYIKELIKRLTAIKDKADELFVFDPPENTSATWKQFGEDMKKTVKNIGKAFNDYVVDQFIFGRTRMAEKNREIELQIKKDTLDRIKAERDAYVAGEQTAEEFYRRKSIIEKENARVEKLLKKQQAIEHSAQQAQMLADTLSRLAAEASFQAIMSAIKGVKGDPIALSQAAAFAALAGTLGIAASVAGRQASALRIQALAIDASFNESLLDIPTAAGAETEGSSMSRRVGGSISAEKLEITIAPTVVFNGETIAVGPDGVEAAGDSIGSLMTGSIQDSIETGEIDLGLVRGR